MSAISATSPQCGHPDHASSLVPAHAASQCRRSFSSAFSSLKPAAANGATFVDTYQAMVATLSRWPPQRLTSGRVASAYFTFR